MSNTITKFDLKILNVWQIVTINLKCKFEVALSDLKSLMSMCAKI